MHAFGRVLVVVAVLEVCLAQTCDPKCQNGGECVNPSGRARANQALDGYDGVCRCPYDFEGEACEIPKCASVRVDEAPVRGETVTGPAMNTGGMELNTIPFGFVGGNVFVPTLTGAYPSLKLTCCGSYECAFFISVYRCPKCRSHDGGLAEELLRAGFSTASCSPKFVQAYNTHPMHTYRHKLRDGESITVTGFSAAHFVAIFESRTFTTDYWCPRPRGPAYRENTCMRKCANPPYKPE